MEKEAEEERMRKQRASAERAFQDGIAKAKLVMRRTPLGTDRNHNRLVFHTCGLQVSKNMSAETQHCSMLRSKIYEMVVIGNMLDAEEIG